MPAAGVIAAVWLGLGLALYLARFRQRADAWDALAQSRDPDLVRLRGRSPLVLVPIAKPASAAAMVEVANALAPPNAGRVLLLSIVQPPGLWERGDLPEQLVDVEAILARSIKISVAAGAAPECLTTVAGNPWEEIVRVAGEHRCESLLIGLGALAEEATTSNLEWLMSRVESDVVVLRSPDPWRLADVRRVVVRVGGRRDQSRLRARLLGSLGRDGEQSIRYVRVLPEDATVARVWPARRRLVGLARDAGDEIHAPAEVELLRGADVVEQLVQQASTCDLLVLGLPRRDRRRKALGETTLELARRTTCPLVLIRGG